LLLPVISRYPRNTVSKAGFTIIDEDQEEKLDVNSHTIMGSKFNLIHDYTFNTRDGSERTSNVQSAQTLTGLFQAIISQEMVAQSVGKRQLFNLINEIFRLSNAGVNLKLEIPEEEGSEELTPPDQQELMQQVQQNSQAIQQILSAVQGGPPQGAPQGPPQGPPQGMPQGPPPNVPAGAMPV